MPKLSFLSENDTKVLARLVADDLARRQNSPRTHQEEPLGQAGDVFIFKGAVAERVSSTEASTATREIYKLVENAGDWDITAVLNPDASSKTHKVFNIFEDFAIGTGDYGVAVQDAYGRLLMISAMGDGKLLRCSLTEDMGATTANEASATIKKMDGTSLGGGTVEDPEDIFGQAKNGKGGLCYKQNEKYWLIQCQCP